MREHPAGQLDQRTAVPGELTGQRTVRDAAPAALQGAIFAAVKAAVDRGAAAGTYKLTGVWPGDEGRQVGKAANHG